ncbi:MAG: MFS transporter [Spirochaetaceae bacterium]|nr:MFS transporter [Spirochaetaceae bacterium]
MAAPLSPGRLQKARNDFYIFNFLNSSSFVLISGSFITLFALRLGASNAIVGLLNAIAYLTYFLMPVGKKLTRKKPIVWVFGWAWVGRYTALLPIVLAPALAMRGHQGAAIGLLLAGSAGFAIFRGIALIGNNPVVDYLGSGGGEKPRSDRGAFMITVSVITSFASMVTGLILALVLGEQATPWTYAIGIGVGIAIGYVGCIFLLRTPEPADYAPDKSASLMKTTKEALKDTAFRRFIIIFLLVSFASGMGRSFLPVYAKEAFRQGDDAVMVYSLFASLGSIAMGLLIRLLVDRLGSKPLLVIFSSIGLLSFVLIAFLPANSQIFASSVVTAVFLCFIHFLSSFGFAGEENTAQTYYFSLVPKSKTLDLSVVYYFAYGLGGAIGSGSSGMLLDFFQTLGLSTINSYRLLYAIICAALVIAIFMMRSLKRLGSASISQSLEVMFSVRDLKAFDLLARLDRSSNPKEEIRLIQELGRSRSSHTQDELLTYLNSPRFEVRMEALIALEATPRLSAKATKPLMREVESHVFSTAYVAARILGRHGKTEAIPVLRKALEVEDYMLQGAAIMALARMGDVDSIPLIESILMRSPNPRVRISATSALEIMDSKSSLPVLVSCLRYDDPPAFVSDEIVLAMASIIGIITDFYPLYCSFIEDQEQGIALLESTANDVIADEKTRIDWIGGVKDLFSTHPSKENLIASFIIRTGMNPQAEIVLAEALMDPQLCYRGLRYLAASYPLFVGPGRAH